MAKEIRIIQIGVGSMGKRRVRNQQYLGNTNITCYDIRKDRVDEAVSLYGIKGLYSSEDVNWKDYSHCIISTPPDQHHQYAVIGMQNGLHTFIEASVLSDGFAEILEAQKTHPHTVLAPSCTMRFDPILVKAKELIDTGAIGQIRMVNHYFGQYLPYWHPYEDIRDFYVSNRDTGASREIVPFDLVYLTWLFGDLNKVTGLLKKTGDLGSDVDVDDIYTFIATTVNQTLINVTIEALSRVSYRETKVIGSSGNLEIDNVSGVLKYFSSETNAWQIFNRSELQVTKSTEEMYVLEMQEFMNASAGISQWQYSLHEDEKVLNTLYRIEEAFKSDKILSN